MGSFADDAMALSQGITSSTGAFNAISKAKDMRTQREQNAMPSLTDQAEAGKPAESDGPWSLLSNILGGTLGGSLLGKDGGGALDGTMAGKALGKNPLASGLLGGILK